MNLQALLKFHNLGNVDQNSQAKPLQVEITGLDIQDQISGSVQENKYGSFFLVENHYPMSYVYGTSTLGDLATATSLPLAEIVLDHNPGFLPTDLLFLDTETTGLSGGTGTVAFLIGVGFFSAQGLVIQQYFMRDYDEEGAMLYALSQLLMKYKCLVTFNGKAFDWNLLKTRFITNRIKLSAPNPPHLDLLYPSRMIWRTVLESCRLTSLEENIMHEIRVGDIPGALIPALYFEYITSRDSTQMLKVLSHNEKDILAMLALIIKINNILENPLTQVHSAWEYYGAGKIFEKYKRMKEATAFYTQAEKSNNLVVSLNSRRKLCDLFKQNKEYEFAVGELVKNIQGIDTPSISDMITLAKLYEHKLKDYEKALDVVQKGILIASKLSCKNNLQTQDLHKRQERLVKKMSQQQFARDSFFS